MSATPEVQPPISGEAEVPRMTEDHAAEAEGVARKAREFLELMRELDGVIGADEQSAELTAEIAALVAALSSGSLTTVQTTTGTAMIAAERERQRAVEGWTPEHDATHVNGELAQAAACYAWPAPRPVVVKKAWPWEDGWKPTPHIGSATSKRAARIRDLVKAGALIAAEIDRLSSPTHKESE